MERPSFEKLFPVKKPIIGMLHLDGNSEQDILSKAMREMYIYSEFKVDGVIIEDYHGTPRDVVNVLKHSRDSIFPLVRGVNILRTPHSAFAVGTQYGAKFVQLDTVQTPDLIGGQFEIARRCYPDMFVFGGIGFKYTQPTGSPLGQDLQEAKSRCEAIVTTGEGTGMETPMEKLEEFRKHLPEFPLVVGAGVNLENVYRQLQVADGAIVGSYFKTDGNTREVVQRSKVRDLMDVVKQVREEIS